MEKRRKRGYCLSAMLMVLFAVWTVLVRLVDVKPIGPQGTRVGFSAFNGAVHTATGTSLPLYTLTDWLGLVPIAVVLAFGALGAFQWLKRGSIRRVDRSILVLGAFYVAVFAAYIAFEYMVINYRPVLIEGRLEASYPSSTTLLVLTVMPAAALELWGRIRHPLLKYSALLWIAAFTVFMVVGRFLSGVHWCTDIVGGALLSASLVCAYVAASSSEGKK